MSTLRLTCPSCHAEYDVPEKLAGRKVRCRRCEQVITVPASEADELELADEDDAGRGPSDRTLLLIIGGVVGMLVLLGCVGAYLLKDELKHDLNPPPQPPGNVPGIVAGSRRVELPPPPAAPATWPPLGTPRTLEPGVVLHEVFLRPGDESGKLWVYLPEKPAGKLPCVLIAPAGTTLIVGMNLGDGDRAEHLPYVRAGFAVVAYAISGHAHGGGGPETPTQELVTSALAFRSAKAGLVNAQQALDFALAQLPQVDRRRVYVAGHSSAGTLALLEAEKEPRIAACVAYAPCADVPSRLVGSFGELERLMPGTMQFLMDISPMRHHRELKCPLFLFRAGDDNVVPEHDNRTFVQSVKMKNKNVKYVTVPRGGHYQSMIDQGIPQAIQWLKGLAPVQ